MNEQVCYEIVDLNKKPEPITALAIVSPPTGEPIPESTVQEIEQEHNTDPQEEIPEGQPKTSTALEDLHPETKKEPQAPNATARFTFADANLFRKLFEAMHVLNDEITLKFDMNSLMVRHMDPSRVAMFDCALNKEVFEEWSVTTPGLCSFNATEVKKIIFAKPPKKGTVMGISIDGTVGRITFTMKDNRTRERSFPTLEPSVEEIPSPKISFNASYRITSKEFAEDIEELTKLSDHVTFLGTNDTLEMKAEGDYAKGNTIYKRGDNQLLDISVKEESKATFSLSYLKDFVDPTLSDIATIEFSTNLPIKVTMLTKFGNLVYYLAPRVETD